MNVKKTDLEIKTASKGNSWSLGVKMAARGRFLNIFQPSVTFSVRTTITNNTGVSTLVTKRCDLLTDNSSMSTHCLYIFRFHMGQRPKHVAGKVYAIRAYLSIKSTC